MAQQWIFQVRACIKAGVQFSAYKSGSVSGSGWVMFVEHQLHFSDYIYESLLFGSGDDAGVDLDSSHQMPDPFDLCVPICKGCHFRESSEKSAMFMITGSILSQELTEAKPGDIFFHRIDGLNKCQIWMSEILCQSSEGHTNGVEELIIVWVAVTEGHQVIKADGSLHYVVVMEGLQPSLVAESTYDKLYRRWISDAPLCFSGSVGNTPAV
ncbi:hypothetical protein BD769DRAFT_1388301 [Suillus cothurnatus]|nr:hypothetical protein BD769DRAFT_1388301 [Suillus cothurnatus]